MNEVSGATPNLQSEVQVFVLDDLVRHQASTILRIVGLQTIIPSSESSSWRSDSVFEKETGVSEQVVRQNDWVAVIETGHRGVPDNPFRRTHCG